MNLGREVLMGGFMPFDMKKKIVRNGKFYCWNKETGKVNEICIREIDIKNCPAEVISDLLSLLDDQSNKE